MIFKKLSNILFKKNNIKTLFLVDILYMKDLNAIYNFKNGDFLIKQLNFILKNQTKELIKKTLNRDIKIKIKNTHADIFEILLFDNLTIEEIVTLKNIIYECVVSNDFKLLNSDSTINIDITIGCSKGADKSIKIYAEKAVYNAKLNFLHYMYYDSFLYKNEAVNENLLETLNYSIEHNLVEPYFQAIMDNSNDEIVKYEALMRIFDKDGNIVMPNIFIHKAKKCRLYTKLMEILFDKIIIYILKHNIHVSINLDYIDILNPQIKKSLISKIKEYEIGSFLTFEILESDYITDYSLLEDFILKYRNQGIKIAIDDFGTGYSNFAHILKIRPNYLKLDGSLIKNLNKDKNSYEMVKSVVEFSRALDIKIIAEYIHTEEVFNLALELGVDEFQGFYLAEPSAEIL